MTKGPRDAQRLPNPALVGKSATIIAAACGVSVPDTTRVLIAELDGVGRDYPLSIESSARALVLRRQRLAGRVRALQTDPALRRHGSHDGHPLTERAGHSRVWAQKPAFRIAVNTPTTFGSTGISSGLDPAMTLGCGGFGGNITSDNITPRHLLNVKRLAHETTSVPNRFERASGRTAFCRRRQNPQVQTWAFLQKCSRSASISSSAPVASSPRRRHRRRHQERPSRRVSRPLHGRQTSRSTSSAKKMCVLPCATGARCSCRNVPS